MNNTKFRVYNSLLRYYIAKTIHNEHDKSNVFAAFNICSSLIVID